MLRFNGSHGERQRPRVRSEHAVVSVFDHGFLCGEASTKRSAHSWAPFLFERHMQRSGIRRACSRSRCRCPTGLLDRCRDTMHATGLGDGPANRAPSCPRARDWRTVLIPQPAGADDDRHRETADRPLPGCAVRRADRDRLDRQEPSGSVNPLIGQTTAQQRPAAQEAARRGAFEGVMRSYRGRLAECDSEPVRRKDNVALTPPSTRDCRASPGRFCSRSARAGIPVPRSHCETTTCSALTGVL